ncbi:hypothetical protein EV646_10988 [Kribbella antiqua]|uniref:Uncharacterized protein n=1 Tax=Kribbella antiqua TaxID=2512217 RepID=A0A4R2IKS3_9ACTN|nr:hypothetical protein [Kribbella antiqua]TCO44916.1 hypothetical protein EV646_10988 [Kribbella antiqua]
MTSGFPGKHFSIGLPEEAEDQSLTALFRHVADSLAGEDPISMDEMLAIGFQTDLGADGVLRGSFTIVFDDSDSETATPAPSP